MTSDANEWVRPIYALAFVIFGDPEDAARWEARSEDPATAETCITSLALKTSLATFGDRKGVPRAIRKGAAQKDTAPSPVERATEHLLEALSSGCLRAVRYAPDACEPVPQERWMTWASVKRRGGGPNEASGLSEADACFSLVDGGFFPVRLSRPDLLRLRPLKFGRARRDMRRDSAADRRQESRKELAEWRFGQISAAASAIMAKPRPSGYGRWKLAADVVRIVEDKARNSGDGAMVLKQQETHLVLKNDHKGMSEYVDAGQREALASRVDAFLLSDCAD